MQYSDVDVQVTIKNKGNILANANIIIGTDYGKLVIKYFIIKRSPRLNSRLNDSIYIKAPAVGSGYLKYAVVAFEKEKDWHEIERLIYSGYLKVMREQCTEEVNPDDIPL
jgi:hypothetical protein